MGLARLIVRAAVITLLAGLALTPSPVTASAATARCSSWVSGHTAKYKCTIPGKQLGPKPPALPAASHQPLCDVKSQPPATFCNGLTPCFYKESVVPWVQPATKPPIPGAKWRVRLCYMSNGWEGEAEWIGQATKLPSRLEQSRVAIAQIDVPEATLAFNPTNRTLVNLDTWFWGEGLGDKVLEGKPAFGLVAYATPSKLLIDPGDGSGQKGCGWAWSKSAACSYAYPRSSLGGSAISNGASAYTATARAIWTLTFKSNGDPVQIPGAVSVLTRDMQVPVVVVEVQTIVTSAG